MRSRRLAVDATLVAGGGHAPANPRSRTGRALARPRARRGGETEPVAPVSRCDRAAKRGRPSPPAAWPAMQESFAPSDIANRSRRSPSCGPSGRPGCGSRCVDGPKPNAGSAPAVAGRGIEPELAAPFRHRDAMSLDRQAKEPVVAAAAMLHARVDKRLRAEATGTLVPVGLSVSDAARVFLALVVAGKHLPFILEVPSAETRAALDEAQAVVQARRIRFETAADLFDDVEKNRGRHAHRASPAERLHARVPQGPGEAVASGPPRHGPARAGDAAAGGRQRAVRRRMVRPGADARSGRATASAASAAPSCSSAGSTTQAGTAWWCSCAPARTPDRPSSGRIHLHLSCSCQTGRLARPRVAAPVCVAWRRPCGTSAPLARRGRRCACRPRSGQKLWRMPNS